MNGLVKPTKIVSTEANEDGGSKLVTRITPPEAPSSGPSQKKKQGKDLNVLIVDDNHINLTILTTFIRKLGCSYDSASNGLIALEKYMQSNRRFDFVLMGKPLSLRSFCGRS